MIKHMIIQVSHKRHNVSSKHTLKYQANKVQRETKEAKNTHSLEAYDLYTFSPFGNKLPKSLKMHSAMRHSKNDLWELRRAKMAWRG